MPIRSDMQAQEYLNVFLRRKWLIIFTFLFVVLGACFYCVLATKTYKSTTTILLEAQQVSENYVRPTLSSRIDERLSTLEQQIMSRTRLLAINDEMNLFSKGKKEIPEENLIKTMRKRIQIEIQGRNSFSLSFMHEIPEIAMRTTNRLAALFIEENTRDREKQAIGTSEFLNSQLALVKKQLEHAEEKVKRYKMAYMGELPQQMEANLNKLSRFQDKYRANADAIRAAEDRKMFLETQLGLMRNRSRVIVRDGVEKVESVIAIDPAQPLLDELESRQRKLSDLSLKYTDKHPEILHLQGEIAELERKIKAVRSKPQQKGDIVRREDRPQQTAPMINLSQDREIRRLQAQITSSEAEIASLKKESEEIQKNILDVQTKVEQSPKREQDMIALTRDYDNLKRAYDDLLRKRLDAEVSLNLEKRQKDELFNILDPASLPLKPFSPNPKKVFAIAFLIACAFGFGGAISFEMMDQTLQDPGDFQRYFKLPILASIPVLQDEKYKRKTFFNKMIILCCFVFIITGYILFFVYYGNSFRSMLIY